MEHLRQLRQDWAVGQSILAEMRRVAPLQDGQKVAFVATWQNAAQLRRVLVLDYGASAFTAPWSRVPFLRLLSGYRLAPADAPASACEGLRPPFEVRQHNGVHVVCMQ